MGIFDRLFGNKQKNGISPEMKKIFDKMYTFLSDEKLQNSSYHPQFLALLYKDIVDKVPNYSGEYGRTLTNPIPVNGAIGEIIYLSRLCTDDLKKPVLFHRIGSIGAGNAITRDTVDVYETVSVDGSRWDILYFNFYYAGKSKIAPAGYNIAKNQSMIYGTNSFVSNFPVGIREAAMKCSKTAMGMPLVGKEVRIAEETVKFNKPDSHIQNINRLKTQLNSI